MQNGNPAIRLDVGHIVCPTRATPSRNTRPFSPTIRRFDGITQERRIMPAEHMTIADQTVHTDNVC